MKLQQMTIRSLKSLAAIWCGITSVISAVRHQDNNNYFGSAPELCLPGSFVGVKG